MDDLVGHGQHAHHPVPRAETHRPVSDYGLPQSLMPALALAAEHGGARGHLSPADGVRSEDHTPVEFVLARVAMQPHHQFQVFRDGSGAVSAHLDTGRFLKQAEGSGHNKQPVDLAPARAAGQEAPNVFNRLHDDPEVQLQAGTADAAAVHDGPVHSPHNAGDRHDSFRVFQDGAHSVSEGFRFNHRIGVHGQKVRALAKVNARVQGVGFAAVLLVDHHQPGLYDADVIIADGLGGEFAAWPDFGLAEGKRPGEFFERVVRAPVVDHRDLNPGILDPQERPHALRDDSLLVVSRDNQSDGWDQALQALQSVEINRMEGRLFFVTPAPRGGQEQQDQIQAVERDEIEKDQPLYSQNEVVPPGSHHGEIGR